jgi:acyl-coenzyme A synthetase/AMP-(fatty) acid ligase
MNPREVGALIFSHPEVAEVCVLTTPNLHAFVVLAPNASATLESLRGLCHGHTSQAEGLQITLLNEMPKNRTGAVDRGQLVEMAQDAAAKKNVA